MQTEGIIWFVMARKAKIAIDLCGENVENLILIKRPAPHITNKHFINIWHFIRFTAARLIYYHYLMEFSFTLTLNKFR